MYKKEEFIAVVLIFTSNWQKCNFTEQF